MPRNRSSSLDTFEEVLASLDGLEMRIALSAIGARPCPAPHWDPHRAYRVAQVNGVPTIQRFFGDTWITAPVEPPAENQPPSLPPPRTTETQLFISHASGDAELARKLASLIDSALTIPARAMRCTSVPGYKLEPGADGPDELRQNLRDAAVVVGLLTPSSINSAYVLMELGAAWGLKAWIVPVLGEGVPFAGIPGPIGQGTHAVQVSDTAGVASLLETISKRCQMPWRTDAARRHDLVSQFVASVAAPKP